MEDEAVGCHGNGQTVLKFSRRSNVESEKDRGSAGESFNAVLSISDLFEDAFDFLQLAARAAIIKPIPSLW